MKSLFSKHIILLTIALITSNILIAQENKMNSCKDYLNSGFVSDGQEYIAKLDENNKAKFNATFYGGSQYRIIACSDITDSALILSVYDTEKNLLFCNKDYNYIPFWNFTFASTIDCIIEIEFESETHLKHEVKLLIGFKEK